MFGPWGPLSDTATDCVMSVYPYRAETIRSCHVTITHNVLLVRGRDGGIRKERSESYVHAEAL